MTRAVLRLKRGREARARSHPWIFKGDVADVTDVAPGSAVAVVDAAGRFVGRGFYNPRPALCCRLLPWADEPLDEAFFRRRLGEALALRARRPARLPPPRPPRPPSGEATAQPPPPLPHPAPLPPPGPADPRDEAFCRRGLGEALALRARGPAGLPPLGRLVW